MNEQMHERHRPRPLGGRVMRGLSTGRGVEGTTKALWERTGHWGSAVSEPGSGWGDKRPPALPPRLLSRREELGGVKGEEWGGGRRVCTHPRRCPLRRQMKMDVGRVARSPKSMDTLSVDSGGLTAYAASLWALPPACPARSLLPPTPTSRGANPSLALVFPTRNEVTSLTTGSPAWGSAPVGVAGVEGGGSRWGRQVPGSCLPSPGHPEENKGRSQAGGGGRAVGPPGGPLAPAAGCCPHAQAP